MSNLPADNNLQTQSNVQTQPNLQAAVFEQLSAENLRDSDWLELIQRLLDYGVLCRDESQVEADFYDRFVRIESLVDDYLSLMGIRLHHDARFQYVRLIPPGARVPGIDDESDTPFNGGLRAKLNQHEVALILTLRAEYDKSLREGQVDETGGVNLSIEALALSLKNLLSRSLPDSLVERKSLFKRLRQLRVIRYGIEADLLSGDSWIKIRPMVVNLVSNELIGSLQSHDDKEAAESVATNAGVEITEVEPENNGISITHSTVGNAESLFGNDLDDADGEEF